MLTIEVLKSMPKYTVFAEGTTVNSPQGVYMTDYRRGDTMRWLAKTGEIGDWCIYIDWVEKSDNSILRTGEKVTGNDAIRKLVPCDREVLKMYRY